MTTIRTERATDPWDQPSAAGGSANILRRSTTAQVVPDDWDNDDEDEEPQDNQKIWEDANTRAPMPELVISSSSATPTSAPLPPSTIFQPQLRILKRPSASTNSSASSASQTPTETLSEREARYDAARQRIFGGDSEKEKGSRKGSGASGGEKGKKGSLDAGAGVGVTRNPIGPSSASHDGQTSKGFKRRRSLELVSAASFAFDSLLDRSPQHATFSPGPPPPTSHWPSTNHNHHLEPSWVSWRERQTMSRSSIHAAYKSLLERGRLSTNAGQAALVDRLATLQSSLAHTDAPQTPHNGVYIYGAVGTGKSRIADLFAATMPAQVTTRRIHFHEFMMDIHMRLHRARSQASYAGDPLVQIGLEVRNESRVLCFDEFQVTDIADAMILKRLFGAIWNSGGVMVATSNRHPTSLYDNGLNRSLFVPFIEELQEKCEVWKLEGNQDYRMATSGQARQTVFFTNSDKFQGSLALALDDASLEPMAIPVMMNRALHVQAARVGESGALVVQSAFSALCEANLGSADYSALCKATRTIYLSGLRQFRADEFDFVRRFITLIDLAYESKTRVVCLSQVPLFQVFSNIVPPPSAGIQKRLEDMSVRGEGGSSSGMMSTFFGEMEWSATGLEGASLASGGAGETDVRFAVGRAVSRLFEMGSNGYGVDD
ncbi:hypothetical protein FIBSPDRAFT_936634 [Athelia psychrophila]|uniref:SUZ domain-containing protein n=1 Tax=Athelia psychrophila TaxID=1759441 RepID=A0A166BSE8_9AGAM|nr:hypothetical protein FIBSPDRAFT_936634 [Fibularhizoctonia sp. CBS 109695]